MVRLTVASWLIVLCVSRAPLMAQDDWRAPLKKALTQEVTAEFVELPLEDAVAYFKQVLNVPILIDTRALDDVGIGTDTPVTCNLQKLSAQSVLRWILRDLDLTWIFQDGAIVITTPEKAEETLSRALFNVSDLVGYSPEKPSQADYETLIDLISSTVSPQSWDAVGGPGSMGAYRGALLISQDQNRLEEIERFLAGLRRIRKNSKDPQQKLARQPLAIASTSAREAKIKAALPNVVSVEFIETPLEEVALFLADRLKINVLLDTRALDDVGIGTDTPVTFSQKLPLRQLLNQMLRPLELTWEVRDESLVITTPEEAERRLVTVLYPVSELLETTGGGGMGGYSNDHFCSSAGGGFFKGAPVAPQIMAPVNVPHWLTPSTPNADNLIDLLTSQLAPQSWDAVGGPGSIGYFPRSRCLVVSQTYQLHQKVDELLQSLRAHVQGQAEETEKIDADSWRLVRYQPLNGQKWSKDTLELVTELVEPESWRDPKARILLHSDGLIIRQKVSAHREIYRMLQSIFMHSVAPRAF